MEEIVIGAPGIGQSCTTASEPDNGLCCQADGVCRASRGEGLTVVDLSANVQATEEGALLDAGVQDDGGELLIEDRGEPDCAEALESQEGCVITVDSGKLRDECKTKEISKEGIPFSAVELVLPDNGDKLSYIGQKLFNNNKSNIKQLVAKAELRLKYYDGNRTAEVVIPAGTRGGYVSANASLDGSWISENSIVLGMSVSNCYIENTEINADGYLENSYIRRCKTRHCFRLEISSSSLSSVTIKGTECSVWNSHLSDGELENSKINKCSGLRNFEIVDSTVENVRDDVNSLVVDGACISNIYNDLLQVTNVGTSKRTICAYKTHRGGVRVSTGCFRGTLDELIIANAQTHLGYNKSDDGYLIKSNGCVSRRNEWCYTEYDMLIKYIKHHFKLDVNTTTIPTKY